MYGGDEVSALVLDLGSDIVKGGYAGEDTPKVAMPTCIGYLPDTADVEMKDVENANSENKREAKTKRFVGHSALSYRRDDMEVKYPIVEGIVKDWDAVEEMWSYILNDQLHVQPSEHPILMTEPSYISRAEREAAVSHLFESTSSPAVFLAKSAVLAAFASAKATALVADCGGSGTTITAVHDGFYLSQSIIRSPVGGSMITNCMQKVLQTDMKVHIRPTFEFKRKLVESANGEGAIGGGDFEITNLEFPKTTKSYRNYCVSQVIRDCKESVLRVSEVVYDEVQNMNVPTVSYELPDGKVVEIGPERFRIPEVMYDPSLLKAYELDKFNIDKIEISNSNGNGTGKLSSADTPAIVPSSTTTKTSNATYNGQAKCDLSSLKSLPAMIIESISGCDPDVRKDLFSSVLLTGGNSVLPNMRERLERELLQLGPQNSKIKVLAQQAQLERRFSSWIGGSILASLGSFQQMWFSKEEYSEHGAGFIHRKAP